MMISRQLKQRSRLVDVWIHADTGSDRDQRGFWRRLDHLSAWVAVTAALAAEIVLAWAIWVLPDLATAPVFLLFLSWLDAVRLCNRLSEADGLSPCYRFGEGDEVDWERHADVYRLLTEAEWEYACRAGTTTVWSCGDDEAMLGEYAWYTGNSDDKLHPVGEKRSNPWDLHDMHGLVWEWCWDLYGPYSEVPERDPVGPDDGVSRALRGGSFLNRPRALRSAYRFRLGSGTGASASAARVPPAASLDC